eukprot:1159608-Pelagomonas_calceolata.AAC.2
MNKGRMGTSLRLCASSELDIEGGKGEPASSRKKRVDDKAWKWAGEKVDVICSNNGNTQCFDARGSLAKGQRHDVRGSQGHIVSLITQRQDDVGKGLVCTRSHKDVVLHVGLKGHGEVVAQNDSRQAAVTRRSCYMWDWKKYVG